MRTKKRVRHASDTHGTAETMSPAGLERARQYRTFGESAACAAKINAVGPDFGPFDPELIEVIDAWPTLPDGARAGIVAAVRQAEADTLRL